jgi:hypothetical protein
MPLICEHCKNPTRRVVLRTDGALWCPACIEDERSVLGQATGIQRDEIPGGITLENYGPNPVTFYSHSERRKYMEAHGLREKEKFCPMPGTDVDPQGIPNPRGYVDAKTLENGAILLTRQREVKWDGVKAGVLRDITVSTVGTAAEVRAVLGIPEPEES